jgi:hypothetical protein
MKIQNFVLPESSELTMDNVIRTHLSFLPFPHDLQPHPLSSITASPNQAFLWWYGSLGMTPYSKKFKVFFFFFFKFS